MSVQDLNSPPFGYSWQPSSDPTGNDLQTKELVHRDESGVVLRSRFFEQVLNTSGLRFVDLSDPSDSSNIFLRDGSGKIVVA